MVIAPAFVLAALPLAVRAAPQFSASAFVGATSSAVFPNPAATNSGPSFDSFFPTFSEFAGPTATGDEAAEIATATAAPVFSNAYPLLNPQALGEKGTSFEVIGKWGNLGPWFSVPSSENGLPEASEVLPDGCTLEQVHVLHRHGARYPTSTDPPSAFADKLQAVVSNGTGFTATGPLSFLNTWSYKLGNEILTPFGRQQMFDLGSATRIKYGSVLKNTPNLPVFRTTSEDRMVHSALNFAAGFFGVLDFETNYHQSIIIESDGFNNTLAPFAICNNSNADVGNFGNVQVAKWQNIYLADALKRFQKDLTGLNLTISDVYTMQQLCAYETVGLGTSEFCGLFSEEEWNGFEYAIDVTFWYSNGPGNPTVAAQGIGWVQDFVSRVTQTPITVGQSTVNVTLNSDPVTFPLDQGIYVDASHDTVISTIIVALNLTSQTKAGPLPTDHIQKGQTYFVNQISPFGTHLTGQIMTCPVDISLNHKVKSNHTEQFIRWVLNDGVLPSFGVKGCPEDKNGLCPLSIFVSAMQEQIATVDFNLGCFGNVTIPNPDLITNGQPVV